MNKRDVGWLLGAGAVAIVGVLVAAVSAGRKGDQAAGKGASQVPPPAPRRYDPATDPAPVLPDDEPGFEYSDAYLVDAQQHTQYPSTVPTGASRNAPEPITMNTPGILHGGGSHVWLHVQIGKDRFTGYGKGNIIREAYGAGWQVYESRSTGQIRFRRRRKP